MGMQELLDVLRAQPFVPFRLHMREGRTRDVLHPDQALVLRTVVVLPILSPNGVPERLETLSLIHVVGVEQLTTPVGTNGA